jgi:hypothetical protein
MDNPTFVLAVYETMLPHLGHSYRGRVMTEARGRHAGKGGGTVSAVKQNQECRVEPASKEDGQSAQMILSSCHMKIKISKRGKCDR